MPDPESDRLRISLLSEIFQCWLAPVMTLRGAMTAETIPRLPLDDSADTLLKKFQSHWNSERRGATRDGRAVRRAAIQLITPRFQLLSLWLILEATASFAQPIIIRTIVRDLRLARIESQLYPAENLASLMAQRTSLSQRLDECEGDCGI